MNTVLHITQRPKRRRTEESDAQQALIKWARLAKIPASSDIELGAVVGEYLFAIPNGSKRDVIAGAILKAEGVKAGVHDLMLPIARGGKHGLWIEMKSAVGTPSKPQREWRARMRQAGYESVVCRGFDAACAAICKYLGMRVPTGVQAVETVVAAEEVQVMSYLKNKVVRSSTYLSLVAKRPCIHCGIHGYSQAAHENHGKGKGMKVDDRKTMPLCTVGANDCHGQFDQYRLFSSRAEHIAMGMKWSKQTRHAIRAEGLWPPKIEFME